MSAQSRQRSREAASHLKERRVERLTGSCPWSCGASIKNGGEALIAHLTKCTGNHRKDYRRRDRG